MFHTKAVHCKTGRGVKDMTHGVIFRIFVTCLPVNMKLKKPG